MRRFKFVTLALAIFALAFDSLECAKILAVFPFMGPSEYLGVQPFLKALAARGHEITAVSAFPQKTSVKNFRDVTLKIESVNPYEFGNSPIDEISGSKLSELRRLNDYIVMGALSALTSEDFQHLLRSNQHFDIIIVEVLFVESLYALGHHFKAPMIGVATFGTDVVIDQLVDNISPVAYVPAPSGKNLDRMNFWQRLDNLYSYTMELMYSHLVTIPQQQQLYEKYFPNATLNLREARRDFALLLLNQHYSYSCPRPLVPNAIEVAGMHINNERNKLPADMETFINASPNGAIYFSLGSNVKSAFLPKQKLAALINAFAKLPVNVLWKFEKTDLPDKPKNVYISKWFPQSDILAHPNVKLFVTHGGMHSLIEMVHHGKPFVGMPVFYDQHLNIARAEAKGLGVKLNFRDFTSEELRNAILEVLNNPKYAEKANEISASFHDRPMTPLDTAIYWTEYVLRHKGTPQMRVAARHLNFFQRHSLDTMAVLFGVPLLAVILIALAILKVLSAILNNNSGALSKKPKKE
ncbi:UDP-glycosyltransferase UGT5-like [Anastrepha obliqua]|uniref:UDP-glycosyltransferase UGT5-like n=1 Tax=Anastrepha obliqua TaxID=95512 RepID=UPI002409F59D|nr:UDP-glycosyltransferase UGT5-like [Anastrepha obliqua]